MNEFGNDLLEAAKKPNENTTDTLISVVVFTVFVVMMATVIVGYVS